MNTLRLLHRITGQSACGYSLIELMVSMTIGLVIIAAIGAAFNFSSSGARINEQAIEVGINGSYALQVLKQDILHAGFMGITATPSAATDLGFITSECGENFVTNLRQFIWGANNDNPLNLCIPDNHYLADTDILVIRRLSLNPLGSADELRSGEIYFRSAIERGMTFLFAPAQGLNPPTFTEKPVFDYKVETHVYYLSPCIGPPDCETPEVPALYRVTLGSGPAMTTHELIATGVENFQVQYGRLTGTDMQFFNADEISGSSTETAPTEWDGVTAVRIWLLVRGSVKDQGYINSETYQLGDKEITVNDNFSRKVFNTVVTLRN